MSIFYMDYILGNDATTATPLGWWSVAYTNGSGIQPMAEEIMSGGTSLAHAHITAITVSTGTWAGGNATGTLYSYGKSGTFQSETCSFSVGGATCSVGADLTYCAWKTITTGATAARIAAGDTVRIAKSPDPTSMGQNAIWGTCRGANILPVSYGNANISNYGTLVKVSVHSPPHSLITGDVVLIADSSVVAYNGSWIITVINSVSFTLDQSIYTSSVACTFYERSYATVVLDTAVTADICKCENDWTAGAQTTSSVAYANARGELFEGSYSIRIVTAATCNANQILAKFGFPVALDLNAGNYQQLSFLLYLNTAAISNGDLEIRLYGDTDCTILRDKFPIPATLNGTDMSSGSYSTKAIVVDLGSNIGSGSVAGGGTAGTIQGIAVYTTVQFNSKTLRVDNFVACKSSSAPDSLTHQSLISKNTLKQSTVSSDNHGDEGWFGIYNITGMGTTNVGRILFIGHQFYYQCNLYGGTAETVPIYKRETVKISSSFVSQKAGTAGNYITYDGGYDISTNNQDAETFFDGFFYGQFASSGITLQNYNQINHISLFRFYRGLILASYCKIQTISDISLNYDGIYSSVNTGIIVNSILNNHFCDNCNLRFLTTTNSTIDYIGNSFGSWTEIDLQGCSNIYITTVKNLFCGWYGLNLDESKFSVVDTVIKANHHQACAFYLGESQYGRLGYYNTIKTITDCNYNNLGIGFYSIGNKIGSVTNCNNNTTGVWVLGQWNYIGEIKNINYNTTAISFGTSSIENNNNTIYSASLVGNTNGISISSGPNYLKDVSIDSTIEFTGATTYPYKNMKVYSTNHDKIENNSYIYTDYGTIISDATVGRITPLSGISWKLSPTNIIRDVNYPLTLSVAKIACNANALVTVKAWMARSSATDICGSLYYHGGQLPGALDDISSLMTCFARSTPLYSIAKSNPTTLRHVAHGLNSGDEVTFTGIVQSGWTALNGRWTVTKIDADSYSVPVDSTSFADNYSKDIIVSKAYTTQMGYWYVNFTAGNIVAPEVGETATGVISGATAKVTSVTLASGTWIGGNAAGTMYFYSKGSVNFQAETVNFTGGGTMEIAANFSYPCLIYKPSHGYISGQTVTFSGITQSGWTALNGKTYPVTVIDTNNFTIVFDSSGFSDNYVVTTTAFVSPWQQVIMTFTPTEAGVAEIEARAWWLMSTADENVWVDSMVLTQA